MRWLAPLAALLALAGTAVAGTTPTTVSFTDGVCTKNIYLRPHGYPASAVDLQPCQVIHVWGGTIGKIKGLGTALTLAEASAYYDKIGFLVMQYPLVTGGWWKLFSTDKEGQGVNNYANGTYTVEGAAH